jgi:hypothetical protein
MPKLAAWSTSWRLILLDELVPRPVMAESGWGSRGRQVISVMYPSPPESV